MFLGRGFSLVEVLVVMAIVLILSTVTFPLFGNLVAATNASEGAELVAQALRLARERARAGLGGAPHGVKFLIVPDQPVEYVIFRGADYAAREPQFDFSQTLPPAASLNFMSGDDEIIFAPGGGRPDDSLNLQITVAESGTKVVKVTNLGLVIVQ